jgi:hypothetical protein
MLFLSVGEFISLGVSHFLPGQGQQVEVSRSWNQPIKPYRVIGKTVATNARQTG